MIYGNTEGIRASVLQRLEALYDLEMEADCFAPPEMLSLIAECTEMIRREISVYITRSGTVADVSVGDAATVGLRDIRLRRNVQRLSKIRCIHTHPSGSAQLSDADLSSLRDMRFDAMAALSVEGGLPREMQAAFLSPGEAGETAARLTQIIRADRVPQRRWMEEIERADEELLQAAPRMETQDEKERAYLVGIESEISLEELQRLAETAGAVCVGCMLQKKSQPENATYLGSGKLDELAMACQTTGADLVIFDDELTPVQMRNLELRLGQVRVLDRTALILDIFAQRAKSREGKLQVELAQMTYQLPRLSGHGVSMSRLGGGIGTRGPGETQLELDRRKIRRRMHALREEIDALTAQRALRREKRRRSGDPVVALVGYTNAGKTTLLNRLSGADALAEDKLFATLDPLVRMVQLPDGGQFLLVDTVGFVSKLPHALVDAFRSTLEEALDADLLVLVSDAASPEAERQRQVVREVLKDLHAGDKPVIEAFNKWDRMADGAAALPGTIPISAKNGEGIETLIHAIAARLRANARWVSLVVPYDQGSIPSMLYASARVDAVDYRDDGIHMRILADEALLGRLRGLLGDGAIREGDIEA